MPTDNTALVRRAGLWKVVGCTALVTVIGFAVVNVADWLSYRAALRAPERVSAADWEAMFITARELARGKGRTLEGRDLPPEFALLQAKDADFSAHDAQVRLWGRGDLAVYVDFRLGPNWEKISHHVSLLPHRSSTVWSADPLLSEKLEPKGRLLTVIVGAHHEPLSEWIVLPSEIRIVTRDSPSRVFRSQRAQSFPLSQQDRAKIVAAAGAIPTGFRGHLHTPDSPHAISDPMNGIYLQVNFAADGRLGAEDVELADIWCEELDTLVEALSAAAPAELAADFKARVARSRAHGPNKRASIPRFDIASGDMGLLNFPWWCVWPRWRSLVVDN